MVRLFETLINFLMETSLLLLSSLYPSTAQSERPVAPSCMSSSMAYSLIYSHHRCTYVQKTISSFKRWTITLCGAISVITGSGTAVRHPTMTHTYLPDLCGSHALASIHAILFES
ncbi:hypothetical protein L202_01968 [Cryptococcus amylolentus CBS 6039]|uniref:Secreted protein n=1 Tax=Cryptococcus amylolentus CBS 6039 TaxID=1295533 RepID=A0A1E3HYY5_9TREE|nr:hypothetical protein L202_01968 [Cryptococcus amylolentus CBS 6039]ODN81550.1 hypothetical protein L202_01968 [Cryptococcus amylolentus CBS 6039]